MLYWLDLLGRKELRVKAKEGTLYTTLKIRTKRNPIGPSFRVEPFRTGVKAQKLIGTKKRKTPLRQGKSTNRSEEELGYTFQRQWPSI